MSRDAPPPLPGGYTVGEKVFYTGMNHTFPNVDKLVIVRDFKPNDLDAHLFPRHVSYLDSRK